MRIQSLTARMALRQTSQATRTKTAIGSGRMTNALGILSQVGLLALGLGACANMRTEPVIVGSVPTDGYHTRHPIILSEAAETLDIPVGNQSATITQRTARTLTLFAQDSRRHGASGLTILVPSGSANEATAYRMSQQVAAALVEGGVPRTAISRAPYKVTEPGIDAPIRVAYARIKASVPTRCGRWPDPLAVGKFNNEDDWEFGCATQTNLAAMVSDPMDLVTPVGLEPADGDRRAAVIVKYRAGTQTKADTGAKSQTIADSVSGGN